MRGAERGVWVTAGVALIGLVWLASATADEPATKPAVETRSDKQADTQANTAAAERTGLESAVTAKGAFEPVEYVVVEFRPKSWTQPLDILRVVPHGTRVNAGDPLVEFDTEKLDRAIADLKVDLELGAKALEVARRDLLAAEALHPLELAEAEQAAKAAAEDLARFLAVEKAAAEEQTRFSVRAAEERLKYAREELRQLEQMYKDKDLTEETEEMILQRTRFDVVQAEQALKRIKENSDEVIMLGIPRQEIGARRSADKAAIAVEKARASLPLQLAQKRLVVAKQEHERNESLRRLAELEADRTAAVVRAPRAGLVYHGRFRDGAWNTAAVVAKAVVGQPVQPAELDFTVLDPDRLQFRAKLDEKDLHLLTTGLAGHVEPTGYPDAEVPVTLSPFVPVPRDGAFEGLFAVAFKEGGPKLLPGMTGTARSVVAKRPDAITVPSGCVFRDDDGSRYVYLAAANGGAVKKLVKTGLVGGGRTEIREGLAAGDRVRTEKP
jgi:multidrug resistance efflux pump